MDKNSRFKAAEDRGLVIGEEKKAKETANNFCKMGLSIEQIAQGVKYPMEVIKQRPGISASAKK